MPGEPLEAYIKWVSTIPEFDHLSEKELKEDWKIRSARELMQPRQFRQYGDHDLELYVDSVTVRGALAGPMEVLDKNKIEQEYHNFN